MLDPISVSVIFNLINLIDQDDKGNNDTFCSSLNKDDIFRDILTTDQNIKNDSSKLLKGIFLYTDVDKEIVNYTRDNFQEFYKLTGDWSKIYILEKPQPNLDSLRKYWKSILYSELYKKFSLSRWLFETKPFNRNESYDIARQLDILPEQLPCLVLLPPLTEISGLEKLIIPIQEVSGNYFRKIFSTLEQIVKQTEENNKYEAIKIRFSDLIEYLDKNSEKIVQQKTTEYQINGTNIFVNSQLRRFNMTEKSNDIKIAGGSYINSVVGGEGKIETSNINQNNYLTTEQKQTLAEAAKEIQQLLEQLSKTDYSSNPTNNLEIANQAVQEIEKNPSLKSRIITALKAGGQETFKELIDHPAVNILMASIEGWSSAK
ncbi:hypothetical protein [Okeania sp. SIO2B3]|uniref:hypothetical protein n=1 Tax=Okeania sp. SIO2B3 TaxID=2607784 RepID=UPI0013BF7857|nr:hypothetical protein [Okeania sp. SIO2B3]NET45467.1 hypothetical protein [Okeania sp. SIO2B3]